MTADVNDPAPLMGSEGGGAASSIAPEVQCIVWAPADYTLLDYAVMYAELGWPVHPLVVGGKVPATENGVKDATTDRSRIEAYWTRNPKANIGLACGYAFDVLDVDVKGVDGKASLTKVKRAGLAKGAWAAAETPTGGLHYLFAPTGEGNHTGVKFGLDSRGMGGYIVAAPSRVTGIERPYRWLACQPERFGPGLDWTAIKTLLDPPRAGLRPLPSGDLYGNRLDGLVAFVQSQGEGNRNAALYWAACHALDEGLSLDPIKDAALSVGLHNDEVERTVASALRRTR